MSESGDALAELLGGSLPPHLAALDDHDLARLVDAIVAAQHHQREALATAIDDGLAIVPRVLRGTVKRVLFG